VGFTIFSLPRPFIKDWGLIQDLAIQSWLNLPDVEILLLGNEEGVKERVDFYNLRWIKDMGHNNVFNSTEIFEKVESTTTNTVLCCMSADILLFDDFSLAVNAVSNNSTAVVVAQRWDLPNYTSNMTIDYIRTKGRLHAQCGVDLHLFNKGFFTNIPPFIIPPGGGGDNWLTMQAIRNGTLVDATSSVTLVHLDHSTTTIREKNNVFWSNVKLMEDNGGGAGVLDAAHILDSKGSILKR
jgi:hypothetical protein